MIGAGWATLEEIETTWSVDDVVRANALLDMKGDVEEVISSSIGGKS